jgi:DNA-binding NtrC family response regulator
MMPHTEKEVVSKAERARVLAEPQLFVVLEGADPTGSGSRLALADVDEVTVGRAEARTVLCTPRSKSWTIGLTDARISARHARLHRTGSEWQVEDLGSTNGTFVNGQRSASTSLHDGDVLLLGRAVLRFRSGMPTPEGTAPTTDAHHAKTNALRLRTLVPALAFEHDVLARVATTQVTVLLLGDTGTGKEVVAHAIHAASRRAGQFVAVNCAALTDSLLEAQLFGHAKGAFSGAVRDAPGFVRAAHDGTLFLDEIGDLPRAAQGVLLRVLQEGEVVPVGTTHPTKVDIRVVAATHQPIESMVERGEFRRDLFSRLRGFTHRLWPLADRREDVGLLVTDLLDRLAAGGARGLTFTAAAAQALVLHGWPLNTRELAQALAHALAIAPDGTIDIAHLPATLSGGGRSATSSLPPVSLNPADIALRDELVRRMEHRRGNVAAVAREMNKAPMQVYRWMQRLGIDPRAFR